MQGMLVTLNLQPLPQALLESCPNPAQPHPISSLSPSTEPSPHQAHPTSAPLPWPLHPELAMTFVLPALSTSAPHLDLGWTLHPKTLPGLPGISTETAEQALQGPSTP